MGTDFTVGDYDPDYFPVISDWCESHRVDPPDPKDLSDGDGVMVMDSDGIQPKGVGFIYIMGGMAFVEGLILAPGLSMREARCVAEEIYQALKDRAILHGVNKLIAFVKSKGMVKECERVGFSQIGNPMAQMVQQLN
jgi:hypothetical protein